MHNTYLVREIFLSAPLNMLQTALNVKLVTECGLQKRSLFQKLLNMKKWVGHLDMEDISD